MEIILLEVEDTKKRKWESIPYSHLFYNSCTYPSTVIQLMWNYTYTMCVFDRLVLYTQSLQLEVCHSKQKQTTGKTSLMTEHFTYLKDKGIWFVKLKLYKLLKLISMIY